jgi:hypothetical protein
MCAKKTAQHADGRGVAPWPWAASSSGEASLCQSPPSLKSSTTTLPNAPHAMPGWPRCFTHNGRVLDRGGSCIQRATCREQHGSCIQRAICREQHGHRCTFGGGGGVQAAWKRQATVCARRATSTCKRGHTGEVIPRRTKHALRGMSTAGLKQADTLVVEGGTRGDAVKSPIPDKQNTRGQVLGRRQKQCALAAAAAW